MSLNRIEELQNFADDFYKKLQSSEEEFSQSKEIFSYNNKMIKKSFSTIVNNNKNHGMNLIKSTSNKNLTNKKILLKPLKKNHNKLNIYNTLTPWVPPNYVGKYFEAFKRLPDHYCMSNWEKVIKYLLL